MSVMMSVARDVGSDVPRDRASLRTLIASDHGTRFVVPAAGDAADIVQSAHVSFRKRVARHDWPPHPRALAYPHLRSNAGQAERRRIRHHEVVQNQVHQDLKGRIDGRECRVPLRPIAPEGRQIRICADAGKTRTSGSRRRGRSWQRCVRGLQPVHATPRSSGSTRARARRSRRMRRFSVAARAWKPAGSGIPELVRVEDAVHEETFFVGSRCSVSVDRQAARDRQQRRQREAPRTDSSTAFHE